MKLNLTRHTPHITVSLVLALLLSIISMNALAGPEPSLYQKSQAEADEAYAAGDYNSAYRQYLNLARKGDSFSQYRLSYMNFQGQGTDVDMSEAFAWAVLASQSNNRELVKYMASLAREVPEAQHQRAAVKAKHYLDRWGDMAIAEDARRGAIREIRECTGSRLGTRCEEVYSMQMPTFWDIGHSHSPFIGDRSTKGSTNYTTVTGVGGPVQAEGQPSLRFVHGIGHQRVAWGGTDTLPDPVHPAHPGNHLPAVGEVKEGLDHSRQTVPGHGNPFAAAQLV